jgi:hypothetical protein
MPCLVFLFEAARGLVAAAERSCCASATPNMAISIIALTFRQVSGDIAVKAIQKTKS